MINSPSKKTPAIYMQGQWKITIQIYQLNCAPTHSMDEIDISGNNIRHNAQ